MLFSEILSFIKKYRNTGKRPSFQLDDEGIEQLLAWAFSRNNLFISIENNQITAVGIAYVIKNKFNGNIANFLPSDAEITKEEETVNEICVIDWIAITSDSRKVLINNFTKRFPNWENQNKWGIQKGVIKLITNKYMNLLKGNN